MVYYGSGVREKKEGYVFMGVHSLETNPLRSISKATA